MIKKIIGTILFSMGVISFGLFIATPFIMGSPKYVGGYKELGIALSMWFSKIKEQNPQSWKMMLCFMAISIGFCIGDFIIEVTEQGDKNVLELIKRYQSKGLKLIGLLGNHKVIVQHNNSEPCTIEFSGQYDLEDKLIKFLDREDKKAAAGKYQCVDIDLAIKVLKEASKVIKKKGYRIRYYNIYPECINISVDLGNNLAINHCYDFYLIKQESQSFVKEETESFLPKGIDKKYTE